MSPEEKKIVGAAAAAVLLCFLPWFSISLSGQAAQMEQFLGGASMNAFNSAEGWLAFLSVAATIGLLIADKSDMLPWSRKACLMAPMVSAGAGVAFMLLFMSRGGSMNMGMMSAGRTFWFYLALISAGVATFLAFKRWQAGVGDEPVRPDGE